MKEQEVVVVKLTTGEEIIALLGATINDTTTLEFIIKTEVVQGGVGFTPFLPAGKSERIVFNNRAFLFAPVAPQPAMETQYLSILANILAEMEKAEGGIELPETKQLIL